jgi:hypothetical protein
MTEGKKHVLFIRGAEGDEAQAEDARLVDYLRKRSARITRSAIRRCPTTIGVPIANHDNNQHSANENIRLQICGTGSRQWPRC